MDHELTLPVDPSLDALIEGLRDSFIAATRARVELVERLASELRRTAERASVLTRIERETHTLRGSAGTFGFAEVGEAAANVERAARACRDGEVQSDVDGTVAALVRTMQQSARDRES